MRCINVNLLTMSWLAAALPCFVAGQEVVPQTKVSPWGVRSFAIQLQKADPAALAASPFPLIVMDCSRDGTDAAAYTPAEIAAVKHGAKEGGPKLVLAYISVGEAEDYRSYWLPEWKTRKPEWIGPENPEWKGNYKVRFWDAAWRKQLEDYLDRLIAQGFDGAFLDVVDAGEFWADEARGAERRPGAEREMADLVKSLTAHARGKHPGFGVFPNGGEGLLRFEDYTAAIDGLFREDIWYNGNKHNRPAEIDETLRALQPLLKARKPVFAIDYVTKKDLMADFYARAGAAGLVPYATVRELDKLVVNDLPAPR
jgi:cysteinyl-tRNA synthetase